jgi:ABC-type multidrug transport system fused ATPase/permease subunit
MTREQGWFRYLKQGLSQTVQEDRVRSRTALGDIRSRLKNLRPFVVRHWRKGVLGSGLILLASLLGLPQPLITRYLIDNVILGRRLSHLLAAAHLSGDLEFRNVTFAYNGRERVLEGVSFRIHPGERVAIVGPSGVGKTTLVSLVLRFYKPVGGEIYFDGRPAVEYEVGSLRQRIGYVAQSTILLNDTIRQNLLYGNPEASDEQLIQAVRAADLQEFIASLPGGYNTRVGESGVRLSEGQKQRLSIARALVKDPNILVLDEPTSALDSQAERSILETLPTLVRHKTLFIVAHCLSTIQNSDRILLLDENRLVAVGTHGSLMESSEYYRSLVARQQVQEKPIR